MGITCPEIASHSSFGAGINNNNSITINKAIIWGG
jgi:hypothetical protein